MSEADIISQYTSSRQSRRSRFLAVNCLRHHLMDKLVVDVKDDSAYLAVYEAVMSRISCLYPFLLTEVERQMRKKKRRQARRVREERKSELHI